MPKSFNNGSWTSKEASRLAEPFKSKVRVEILGFLDNQKQDGATDQELELALNRPGNTIRPGRVNLVKEKLVIDSGKWRYTQSHRPAKVWVLSQYISKEKIESNKSKMIFV